MLLFFQISEGSVYVWRTCFNKHKKISPPSDLLKKSATKFSQNFDSHFKVPVTFQLQRQQIFSGGRERMHWERVG